MNRSRGGRLTGLVAALLLLLCAMGAGAAGRPTDAVLVIDSSGSMKRTDPQRLRVPAAKLFASLLGDEDRIGIVSFSDAGYPVVHLTRADEGHREAIEAGIEKISAKGVYTNLHAAVETGLRMLEEQGETGRRRMILLLSDGQMDTGDAARDAELRDRLFDRLVPRLKERGIRIYAIAFTEASDLELLAALAHATGGIARLASNDRVLHEVFGAIFETAKAPDMLPIENGEFLVDDAVSEFTVVASKARPDVRIVLEMPDGRRIAAVNAGRAVHWFQSEQFDMITVKGPPPGAWRLLAADAAGRNRAYVVTDLGLEADFAPEVPEQGGELRVRAWLTQGEARLTRPEVLAATGFSVEVTPEAGEPLVLPLADSGVSGDERAGDALYSNRITLARKGPHQVRVRAESATFRREKIFHLDVLPAAAPAAPPAQATPAAEAAEPSETPEAGETAEPPPDPPPGAVEEERLLEPESEGPDPAGLWEVVAVFLVANLVIGGAIAGYLIRRRKRRGELSDEDAADLSWMDAAAGEDGPATGGEQPADAGSADTPPSEAGATAGSAGADGDSDGQPQEDSEAKREDAA